MSVTTELAVCRPPGAPSQGLAIGSAQHEEHGEDRLLADPDRGLFGVFDGVGGHVDGAAAAELAAKTVAAFVPTHLSGCASIDEVHAVLVAALHAADAAIEQHNTPRRRLRPPRLRGSTEPETSGATTATVLLVHESSDVRGPVGLVAHIGDSRAQLLRHGTFATITLDHAAFADPDPGLARGQQDRLDAVRSLADLDDPVERAAFSSRHMLTQALTGTGELEVRTYVVPLRAGDRLLLDSDGLHDNLTAAEIAALLAPGTPQEAADSLVGAAVRRAADGREACIRAKPDDISALVVEPRTVGSAR